MHPCVAREQALDLRQLEITPDQRHIRLGDHHLPVHTSGEEDAAQRPRLTGCGLIPCGLLFGGLLFGRLLRSFGPGVRRYLEPAIDELIARGQVERYEDEYRGRPRILLRRRA
jgi:hypothetical protein